MAYHTRQLSVVGGTTGLVSTDGHATDIGRNTMAMSNSRPIEHATLA